jgi:hypothetical protein
MSSLSASKFAALEQGDAFIDTASKASTGDGSGNAEEARKMGGRGNAGPSKASTDTGGSCEDWLKRRVAWADSDDKN